MLVWNTATGPIAIDRTLIMGILNVTPDSFSDGGAYANVDAAVAQAIALQTAGADILDIGGQSTRPGATLIPWEEEWSRLSPVLAGLCGRTSIPLSVDTFYPQVAKRAVAAGAAIVNDVSGSLANGMCATVADLGAGLVLTNPTADARRYFDAALAAADEAGLARDRLCLDIGIGFGKTREDDRRALATVGELIHEYAPLPFLVGASRKRVTDPAGRLPPQDRLAATIALHTVAQLGGAHILRVHDVAQAKQAAAAVDTLKEYR